MPIHAENVKLPPGESIRLLCWKQSLADVEVLCGDGTSTTIPGSGTIWHAHGEVEITLVSNGEGTRFVGDSIMPFTAPDVVMIGPELPHFWRFSGESSGVVLQFDPTRLAGLWTIGEAQQLESFWPKLNRGCHLQGEIRDRVAEYLSRMANARGMARIGILLELLHDVSHCAVSHGSEKLIRSAFCESL